MERMGHIYNNAISTVVWLGVDRLKGYAVESPLAIAAMSLVPLIAEAYETARRLDRWNSNWDNHLTQLYTRRWYRRVDIPRSYQIAGNNDKIQDLC